MKHNQIIAWFILVLPALYFIGYKLNYEWYALLVAMGYGVLTIYLMFWDDLVNKKVGTE